LRGSSLSPSGERVRERGLFQQQLGLAAWGQSLLPGPLP
jgi:hypothetical protein